MTNRLRLLSLGGAAGVALALAAPALATYTPKLGVGGPPQLGATGTAKIQLSQGATDDPTASVIIYAPKGYGASLAAADGTVIGTVTAKVSAADLGGAILPLTGEVKAATGATLISAAGAEVPLSAAATLCTGTPTHTAFLLLVLSAAGQTLRLPGFVDAAAGAEAAFASYKIQFCLPPPDIPANDPRRATFGAKLIEAVIDLKNVFTNPGSAGLHAWSSIWTPYTPGAGTANVPGTVEARSIVPLPVSLALRGTYDRKTKSARLSGSITAGGQPVAGQTLPLFGGGKATTLKRLGSTLRTSASGAFAAVRKILKTTFFQIRVSSPARDFTAAGCATPGPVPCVSATIGPVAVTSNVVRVVPR